MTMIAFRPLAVVTAKVKGRDVPMPDASFVPTPSTEDRFSRQRIIFRPFPGGFRLAAQHELAGEGGPLVPLGDSLSLLFAVRLGGSLASGDAAKVGPNIFLTNRNASGTPQGGPQLSREEIVGAKDRGWIVPRRHVASIALGTGSRPKTIEVKSAFGSSALATLSVEAPAGAEAVSLPIALDEQEGVAFLLKPKPSGTDRLVVADNELARMRADGALELVLKTFPGPAPAAGREFTALFER